MWCESCPRIDTILSAVLNFELYGLQELNKQAEIFLIFAGEGKDIGNNILPLLFRNYLNFWDLHAANCVFGKSIVDGWPVLSDDRAVGDLGLHEKCQR